MLIRVVLADDHATYREALCSMLNGCSGVAVLGVGSCGREAVRLVEEFRPDVVMIDVRMKDMNGIDAVATILQRSPHTAVLMLSVNDDKQYVMRAVRAG